MTRRLIGGHSHSMATSSLRICVFAALVASACAISPSKPSIVARRGLEAPRPVVEDRMAVKAQPKGFLKAAMPAMNMDLPLLSYFAFWYLGNYFYTISNKRALVAGGGKNGYPMIISTLQLGVGVLYALYAWAAPDMRSFPTITVEDVVAMIPVAFCAAAAHSFSVFAQVRCVAVNAPNLCLGARARRISAFASTRTPRHVCDAMSRVFRVPPRANAVGGCRVVRHDRQGRRARLRGLDRHSSLWQEALPSQMALPDPGHRWRDPRVRQGARLRVVGADHRLVRAAPNRPRVLLAFPPSASRCARAAHHGPRREHERGRGERGREGDLRDSVEGTRAALERAR